MPFNDILDDPKNELLRDRLQRLAGVIPSLGLTTREEYLANIFSRVNAILANGDNMSPLGLITPESPAVIGDLVDNFNLLSRDSGDIASYVGRVEALAASIFNQISATQNCVRQKIRQQLYASGRTKYVQEFIDSSALVIQASMIDPGQGSVYLPVLSEADVTNTATISIGAGSVGSGSVEGLNGALGSFMSWRGPVLEMDITFANPTIVNRLKIGLDDYQGLELVSLISTSDGISSEDIFQDLGIRSLDMSAVSNKYSGDVTLDFPPKQSLSMKLVIEDRAGDAIIALRSLQVLSRQYDSSGTLTAQPIALPIGEVALSSQESTWGSLTSIVHQISYDGISYKSVAPGALSIAATPFWYKAVLSRSSSAFSDRGGVSPIGADPLQDPNYVLASSSSLPLGNGIVERTLVFQQISGPVALRDQVNLGTLTVQQGSVLLSSSQYAFSGGVLSFPSPTSGITISYQAPQSTTVSLSAKEKYYTPFLNQVTFEVVD